MSDTLDAQELDPGVRAIVLALNARGFKTCDSGDGRSKEPGPDVFPYRHVFIQIPHYALFGEATRALHTLRELEPNVDWKVEANWSPNDQHAFLICTV